MIPMILALVLAITLNASTELPRAPEAVCSTDTECMEIGIARGYSEPWHTLN